MTVSLSVEDGIAVVRIDSPPVNGLSLPVRRGLVWAFERLLQRADVKAVVLTGGGRGFSAGGDLRELGTPASSAPPGLSQAVHPAIERCGAPVVAALHGFAIGGGLETALACNYRVAESDTKIALPEVKHGIIPLSATQRLPRLLGIETALALMSSGEARPARAFADTGLFDRVVGQGQALGSALELARKVAGQDGPHPLVRDLPAPPAPSLDAQRERLGASGASAAQVGLLEAVAACAKAADFEAGMGRARTIYDQLAGSLARDEVA